MCGFNPIRSSVATLCTYQLRYFVNSCSHLLRLMRIFTTKAHEFTASLPHSTFRLKIEQLAIFIYIYFAGVSCVVLFAGRVFFFFFFGYGVFVFSEMKRSKKKGQTHCQLSTFVMFYSHFCFSFFESLRLIAPFRILMYAHTRASSTTRDASCQS